MQITRRVLGTTITVVFLWGLNCPPQTLAYTPESDTVRRMVNRAVGYLSSDQNFITTEYQILAAMAVYKARGEPNHPLIQEAIKESVEICHSPESIGNVFDIYATCVVGLLFCELDPKRFEKEIDNVIQSLQARQKPFGGWGYPKPHSDWETGDTSMTQFAVLCTWLANNTGAVDVSPQVIRNATNWLIRTQDVHGAWGYQGRDPGSSNFSGRLRQSEIRHSLCVAGLGSMYICSNMLGFTAADGWGSTENGIPPALKPIVKETRQSDSLVDRKLVERSIRDGNRWYTANYRINPPKYTMYYLYTLERYQSFKELAAGRVVKEPRWYNDGVNYLKKRQNRRGYWDVPGGTGRWADTCFAVYFLVRSTKKTIAKGNDEFSGLLTAGRGLPGNTENVQLKRGRIVTTPFQGTANALLEILNNETHPDFESATEAKSVTISSNPKEREQQIKQLQRLTQVESYKVRLVAVNTLVLLRDLDNVPTLIFALSDPDLRVVKAARDGLRLISRKFSGFGLSDDPSPAQRKIAIEAWKNWYLSIRPDDFFGED